MPTGFTQLATTRDAVVLGWSPSSDNTGVVEYDVYRDLERIATTKAPNITLSALACASTYAYLVDAVDAAGNRSLRANVYVRTAACVLSDTTPPTTPTGLAASGIAQTGLSLSWNASSDNIGVAGYDVYRNGTKVASPATTYLSQSGLTCGTSYTLAVAARDAAGNVSQRAQMPVATSACSTSPPAQGDTTPPTTPTGLAASGIAQTGLSLSWNASSDNIGVAGYDVYRNGTKVASPATTYLSQSGLTCGTSYTLAVAARDAAGNVSQRAQMPVATSACSTSPPPDTCPNGQFRAQYFSNASLNGSPVRTACDPKVDFDWADGQPAASVPADGFSTRWGGTFDFAAGDTTFSLVADDGVRLWVDGAILVDAWKDQSATTYTARRTLTAGAHVVKLEYYENWGKAVARLSWSAGSSPPLAQGDTTPPTTPTGLAASGIAQTGLSLSWNASSDNIGVAGYDVYRNGSKVASPATTYLSQSGLTCGTSYTLAVAARDAAGNVSQRAQMPVATSACSTSPPAQGDTTPPTTPTGLAVSGATGTSVSLAWSASTDNVGVTEYRVYVNGGSVTVTSQLSATVAGLTCGSAYTFAVDAVDREGNNSTRASVTGSTAACPDTDAPSAPQSLVATSRTTTSIALSWSPSADDVGVVGYGLYRAGAPVGTSNSTTGIFSGLACNTNYTLAVDGFDAAGNRSSKSTVMVATTACPDTQPPSPPTGLAATNVTQTGLTLTWNPSSDNFGVTAYDVFRTGTKVATATGTSSIQSGLSCGTSYTFAVVALDAARNASQQAQITRSTSACPVAPPATGGPITITTGGTYVGHWVSSSSTPAVTIQTAQPVIIENSIIENTAGGHLVSQSGSAAQVTIRRTVFNGIAGGYGRAIRGENFKSWTVENCTLNRTGGIYFLIPGSAPSITIRKNRQFNVQGDGGANKRQFLQLNGIQGGTILAEWNEVINTFGQSYSEDVFSVFNTSNAVIRNNYVEGGYAASAGAQHTGTGILLADVGGNNNVAHDNQIVGVTNLGIGITAGQNNKVYNNRVVSDGRLPDGTPLAGANNGIVVWNAYGTTMTSNDAYNNVVGTYHSGSPPYRNFFPFKHLSTNSQTTGGFPRVKAPVRTRVCPTRWITAMSSPSGRSGWRS